MASEEEQFDIDIYGDAGGEEGNDDYTQEQSEEQYQDQDHDLNAETAGEATNGHSEEGKVEHSAPSTTDATLAATDDVSETISHRQGVKRKGTSDERPVDPNATAAVLISDLHWWTTEDDIRGWANQAGCEDELKEVTFSEHKVNGKSKGYGTHPVRSYIAVIA